MIRTMVKVGSIIFERVLFNIVRKLYMTIIVFIDRSELGRKNID